MSTDAIRTSLDQDCTPTAAKYDVIAVGSLVVDVSCHYAPLQASTTTAQPTSASSNPATIRQRTGGVAYNIALALHYLGHKPLLMSVVADDAAGDQLLNQIKTDGLSAEGILHLPSSSDVRTGQYVGSYDASKEFIFGMADVSLMELTPKLADIGTWLSLITTDLLKAIVLDLCFPSSVLTAITSLSQQHNIPLILEPVSAPLASKLIHDPTPTNTNNVFPRSPYALITPNESELIALHSTFTAYTPRSQHQTSPRLSPTPATAASPKPQHLPTRSSLPPAGPPPSNPSPPKQSHYCHFSPPSSSRSLSEAASSAA